MLSLFPVTSVRLYFYRHSWLLQLLIKLITTCLWQNQSKPSLQVWLKLHWVLPMHQQGWCPAADNDPAPYSGDAHGCAS
jgi:hypothetical protein